MDFKPVLKMKTILTLCAICGLAVLASCSKNNAIKPTTTTTTTTGTTGTSGATVTTGTVTGGTGVYVAGYEILYKVGSDSLAVSAGIPRVAKIWKNGTPVNLTDGSHDAAANAVYANATDVYAVGFERNQDSIQVATIWKNGVETKLGDGKNDSYATGVFMSGNDVYVAGNVITNNTSAGVIWKNGVAGAVSKCYMLNGMSGYNGDIYVVGQDANLLPAYWKNGTLNELPNSQNQDYPPKGIYVDGGNVYVAGQGLALANHLVDWFEKLDTAQTGLGEYTTWINELSTRVAMAWKNGVASNPTDGDEAVNIFAHNGEVYVVGERYFAEPTPTIWKNGLAITYAIDIPLTGTNTYSAGYLNSLIVNAKGVVYVAGYRATFVSGDYVRLHTIETPLLWQNGKAAPLSNGDSATTLKTYKKSGGRAMAMFIVN